MSDDKNNRPHLIIDLGAEEKRRIEKLVETGEGKLARKIQEVVESSLREDGEVVPEGVEVVPVVLLFKVKRKKNKSPINSLLDPFNLLRSR
jgi:hypothetical protein